MAETYPPLADLIAQAEQERTRTRTALDAAVTVLSTATAKDAIDKAVNAVIDTVKPFADAVEGYVTLAKIADRMATTE